jgi:hypothetical protein
MIKPLTADDVWLNDESTFYLQHNKMPLILFIAGFNLFDL